MGFVIGLLLGAAVWAFFGELIKDAFWSLLDKFGGDFDDKDSGV